MSCTGSRAEQAAVYPLQLCKAILRGIKAHLKAHGWLHDDTAGVMMDAEEERVQSRDLNDQTLVAVAAAHRGAVDKINAQRCGGSVKKTYDALTKQEFDAAFVLQARPHI